MNAHTPIAISPLYIDAISGLHSRLDQIANLAVAASVVIEHQLGREAPADILDAVMSAIEAAAKDAAAVCEGVESSVFP